jgi:hypothetical protein
MRIRCLLAVVAVLLALPGCSVVNGSGRMASESRPVSQFEAVELTGSGEVTISLGETASLLIEADDNVLPTLTTEVDDSTLRLGVKPRTMVQTRNPIRYWVTVPDLTEISTSGSGSVTAPALRTSKLRVHISGSGPVTVRGSTDEQDIRLSGSGRFDGAGLQSRKANVEVSGSGEAIVAVSTELEVEISGSGTVTYSGDPRVEQSLSGSGKLIKR